MTNNLKPKTKTGYIDNENIKEDIKKIERRRKYRHSYFGRCRERNMCPNCHSLDVAKRTTTHDYKCYNCKWIGKDIKKIMI
jgi:ribosomal protein L37AE/L43A